MTPTDNTSETSDTTIEPLPATAEIDTPAERTYSITLCGGNYANVIVDLQNTDDLYPEIRVYPDPGANASDERVVIPLTDYDPKGTAQPVVNVPDAETPASMSIQLPVAGELLEVIMIELENRVPYVTVTIPDGITANQTNGPAFQGYAVHTDSNR
jgi:hypothetical protein